MSKKTVTPQKASFIRYQLENGDDRAKKVALQEIARSYRSGEQFTSDTRNGLELTINGLLSGRQDDKVIRWCLNCIAQMGTRDGSLHSVERALQQHDGKPGIVAAAVAAASKLYGGKIDECKALGSVQPEVKTLAALQVTPPSKLDLSNFKINIETADDEILKLALITVGLNRAFENMFHPRHSNGEFVSALGQHDNIIVKQYSVWSVIENTSLSIENLGIPLATLEEQPPNVQSKLLQLAAASVKDEKERQDIILRGSYLDAIDAREGLAKGLLHVFYEGLQDITIAWFEVEASPRVRELLAEHIARFSGHSNAYEEHAIELFEREPSLKQRLYLGAEGTGLFSRLKAHDLRDGTDDLFAGSDDLLISNIRKTKTMPSKNVLMLCVSPADADRLRLDQEARDLKEQLRLVENPKQIVEVSNAWAVRTNQVQMEILNNEPNILHFSGHGNVGELYFEDHDGNAVPVSAEAIAGLVKLSETVECIVLNACYSASLAGLLKPHVKAVIGCTASIDDDAAVKFSSAFYRAISHNMPYQKAFDYAVNELELNSLEAEAKKYDFTDGTLK
ncbi:MAG: CHAT domain-containing protein [Hyphomicrobiales bacterium]|uniref:CHAT domain-containing protein n=1 Tax=Roseibium sp. TaxID=1936156 RepID=UPI0032657D95